MRVQFAPWLFAAILVVLSLTSCTNDNNLSDVQGEVAKLTGQVSALETELRIARDRLTAVEVVSDSSTNYDDASFAIIGNPIEPGYTTGRTPFGKVAFVVDDLTAYGKGTRMTLRVMNMAAVNLSGGEMTVAYNSFAPREMLEKLNNKEALPVSPASVAHRPTTSFQPGRWTIVVVTLPDLPPEKIRWVSIRFIPEVITAIM